MHVHWSPQIKILSFPFQISSSSSLRPKLQTRSQNLCLSVAAHIWSICRCCWVHLQSISRAGPPSTTTTLSKSLDQSQSSLSSLPALSSSPQPRPQHPVWSQHCGRRVPSSPGVKACILTMTEEAPAPPLTHYLCDLISSLSCTAGFPPGQTRLSGRRPFALPAGSAGTALPPESPWLSPSLLAICSQNSGPSHPPKISYTPTLHTDGPCFLLCPDTNHY